MRSLLAILALAGTAAAQPVAAGDPAVLARDLARLRGVSVKRVRAVAAAVLPAAEVVPDAEVAAEGLALVRWGLVPADLDYAALRATLAAHRGADPARDDLARAHAIGHALQPSQRVERDLDARRARQALREGAALALVIELAHARAGRPLPWTDPRATAALIDEVTAAALADPALAGAPLVVRETVAFSSRAGLGLVAALRRRQGWRAVDAALARPPRSTAQVLHPARYADRAAPRAIALARPAALRDHVVAHDAAWGELGFQLFLRGHGIDPARAAIAAAGWAGDRAIVMVPADDGGAARAVGLSRSRWDTEADAIEAAEAAELALAAALPGAVHDRAGDRARWVAVDGTHAWVERRGAQLVLAIGVPAGAAEAVGAAVWK